MNRQPFWNLAGAACIGALVFFAGAARAQPHIALDVSTHTLDNGLHVVLAPDHSAPVIALSVTYDVGSRNEEPGRSGFAHLFEHMMFQGSANVPKGAHFQFISDNGGRMNGTTSKDRTNYFEVLPADRLELGLWLEADRMRSLDISEANFENQREVVKEERRMRVDNQPYIPAWFLFQEMALQGWAYQHSVIGSMQDLDDAELGDVQAFFDEWYRPSNATLVVVGDFDSQEALTLIDRHFGSIPSGPAPPAFIPEDPEPLTPFVERASDPLATQPALLVGWRIPAVTHPDQDALDILGELLATGRSSRLYRRLVRDDQSALSVSAGPDILRGPGLFSVWSIAHDTDPAILRQAILEEIQALLDNGITADELEAARNQLIRMHLDSVEGMLGRSVRIGQDSIFFGDPGRFIERPAALSRVTVQDVEAAAQRWLQPGAASAMEIVPATAGGDADEEAQQ